MNIPYLHTLPQITLLSGTAVRFRTFSLLKELISSLLNCDISESSNGEMSESEKFVNTGGSKKPFWMDPSSEVDSHLNNGNNKNTFIVVQR